MLEAPAPGLTAKSSLTLCYQALTPSAQLTLQPFTKARARKARGRATGVITTFTLTAPAPVPAQDRCPNSQQVPSSPLVPSHFIPSSCDRHQRQTPKIFRKSQGRAFETSLNGPYRGASRPLAWTLAFHLTSRRGHELSQAVLPKDTSGNVLLPALPGSLGSQDSAETQEASDLGTSPCIQPEVNVLTRWNQRRWGDEGEKERRTRGSCDLWAAPGLCACLSTPHLPATSHFTCHGSQGVARASQPMGEPAEATPMSRSK